MKKVIIGLFFLLVGELSLAQEKNIIVVNVCVRSITNRTPKIKIDGIETEKIVYKSFIVLKSIKDSVTIIVPDNAFLKKKENKFVFALEYVLE